MRNARPLSAAISGLLLSLTTAALAEPAHASTAPVVTVTVQDYTNPTHPRYGDFISVIAEARGPSGEYLTTGDVQIQIARPGSATWRDVGNGSGTYTSYSLAALNGPVQFRAIYSGGTSGFPAQTYQPSTSAPAVIATVDRGRKIVRSSGKRVCYRVGPASYENKTIKFFAKRGESDTWRPAGQVETNGRSQYCTHIRLASTPTGDRPQLRAFKIVYARSAGMKRSVEVRTY